MRSLGFAFLVLASCKQVMFSEAGALFRGLVEAGSARMRRSNQSLISSKTQEDTMVAPQARRQLQWHVLCVIILAAGSQAPSPWSFCSFFWRAVLLTVCCVDVFVRSSQP